MANPLIGGADRATQLGIKIRPEVGFNPLIGGADRATRQPRSSRQLLRRRFNPLIGGADRATMSRCRYGGADRATTEDCNAGMFQSPHRRGGSRDKT